MKNLILGVAKGYAWDVVEPFVASCKRNCPAAELVLFVDDISDFTRGKLISSGATLEKFPAMNDLPNNTRWKVFGDFLSKRDDFAQVFITDTRDVIFQGDIFAPFVGLSDWLGLVTEADDLRGSRTGNDSNYEWLTNCFGQDEAERLADQQIICSGTVIGSCAAMKIFCRELWKILEHKTGNIFDQAVTNYLVYEGLLPIENLFAIDTISGEIFTAFLFHRQHPIKIRGDKILRGDGGLPEVVHQYDRHAELVQLVDEIYRDKNFSFDPRFSDTRSVVEQVICLLYADKVAEAAKLFLQKFLSPADFRTATNSLITVWELAAQKNFTPAVETLELAAQNVLATVEKFSDVQLYKLQKIFMRAAKNHHAIDPDFKRSFAARLMKIAQDNRAAGAPEEYCRLPANMARAINSI